jgi:hypothetical protein
MIKVFNVEENIVEYMTSLLKIFLAKPELVKDIKQSSLSANCFSTLNLLKILHNNNFYNYIDELKTIIELHVDKELDFFYVHMVDYANGGIMNKHSHDHNEDYSFILYLNTCDDGYTVLSLKNCLKIKPEQGKMLVFSSNIPHSSEYSNSKKVLVGGLKVTRNVF